jgi:hypothetical protein
VRANGDQRQVQPGTRERGADRCTRVAQRREDPCGRTGSVDQPGGPVALGDVVERRGGGVGAFRTDGRGQPTAEQVGYQQQVPGGGQALRGLGRQPADGVEPAVLDAGDRVVVAWR